jgi:DNA processing protein
VSACETCLRRTWLLGRLAGALDRADQRPDAVQALLALPEADLVRALLGTGRRAAGLLEQLAAFDPEPARVRAAGAELTALCRHDPGYPQPLLDLPAPPAVVHLAAPGAAGGADPAGHLAGLLAAGAVAIVGARRASPYGLEVARTLARDLAVAGVTVISGMALGADSAAHRGALDGAGRTLAVLPGGADVSYPASKRRLHVEIVSAGAALAELPPGLRPHRWCFPARNRIIAALAGATVVVEAGNRSGSLITARCARELGRDVGAVPGRVSSPLSAETNALIRDGAHLVRSAQDVLDLLFGVGGGPAPVGVAHAGLEPRLQAVLDAVLAGQDTLPALAVALGDGEAAMVGLAELELLGVLRRADAGRYQVVS